MLKKIFIYASALVIFAMASTFLKHILGIRIEPNVMWKVITYQVFQMAFGVILLFAAGLVEFKD